MSRSYRRRARAKERARALTVGTSLTVRVPCSHGNEHGHDLTIELGLDGTLRHVSSACTRNPPPEDEVAVMQGLLGDANYHRCNDAVDKIVDVFARFHDREERRRALHALPFDKESQPALWAVIEKAREHSIEVWRKRDEGGGPLTQDELEELYRSRSQSAALQRATRDLVLPAGWQAQMRLHMTPRRRGKSNGVVEHETELYLEMRSRTYSHWHTVAFYKRGGRWSLRDLTDFAEYYDRYQSRDSSGKKTCAVCGKRVTSLAAHVKTQAHHDNVTSTVLATLEVIGPRLARKQWRKEND